MTTDEEKQFAVQRAEKRVSRLREFAVVEYDALDKQMKEMRDQIDQLEFRKRELWQFIADLDEMLRAFKEMKEGEK